MEPPNIDAFEQWCRTATSLSKGSRDSYKRSLLAPSLHREIIDAGPGKGWSCPIPINVWASNDGYAVVRASAADKNANRNLSNAIAKYMEFLGKPRPPKRGGADQPQVEQPPPPLQPEQPSSVQLQQAPQPEEQFQQVPAQLPVPAEPPPEGQELHRHRVLQPEGEEELHRQAEVQETNQTHQTACQQPDGVAKEPPVVIVLSGSRDIVAWVPRFMETDYAKERHMREHALGYSTKEMQLSTRMAWQSEKEHFATLRRYQKEKEERGWKRKAAELEAVRKANEKVVQVVDKFPPVQQGKKRRKPICPPPPQWHPHLTKKYLKLNCDKPELAAEAFRMLSQSLGLCQQVDDVNATDTEALLLYRKGAWKLTERGAKCVLYANDDFICLDHPLSTTASAASSTAFAPLFALTECTNVFTTCRFAGNQHDGLRRYERLPDSRPFVDNILEKTTFQLKRFIGDVRRTFEKYNCDTTPIYGFPFVQTKEKNWNKQAQFTFEKITVAQEAKLKGCILKLHLGMLYTFLLNSIVHNSELIHQRLFHQLLRQLLIAVHPDQWTVQTSECERLQSFLRNLHHGLTAWHLCFKISCP